MADSWTPGTCEYEIDFIQGYIVAALWSTSDESRPDGGDPLDRNYTPRDLTKAARKAMEADCKAFICANKDDLDEAANHGLGPANCGHDFWLTRAGHGSGFWDRGLGKAGDRLTEASKKAGERYLSVYRGRIYQD